MRFAAPAVALSLALALAASMGAAAPREADPRAVSLVAEGRAALAAGDAQRAIDAFEAALTVDPGHTPVYLELAEAARRWLKRARSKRRARILPGSKSCAGTAAPKPGSSPVPSRADRSSAS